MRIFMRLLSGDLLRRSRDSFLIGYNIVFPLIMVLLLGYLTSESYGKVFRGYQYYSVVMLPFCIAMASISAAYAGKDEAYKTTAIRFISAPVSIVRIVLSKLISLTIVISGCNLIVLLSFILAFQLPVGDKFVPVLSLLTAETFAICSIGLFIGLGMKNFIFIKNIMNLPIMAAAILAGVFYPFGTLKDRLVILIKLSPLTWINRSLFLAIYDNSEALLWRCAVICVLLGSGFAWLAVKLFKKEEYIHGDLPGYEK